MALPRFDGQVVNGGRESQAGKGYSSPEFQTFVQEFHAVRSRQLEALRPLLTDSSGRTSQEASGFQHLIYSGWFADTHSRVYQGAIQAQRTIQARRVAELQQRKDQQAEAAVTAFVGFLVFAAAANQAAEQALMDKGICPECRGNGETTTTTENKCYTCAGSGVTYVRGGLCPICGGLGTSGPSSTTTETCQKCDGNGKYAKP